MTDQPPSSNESTSTAEAPSGGLPPTLPRKIGQYSIEREIGRGGMGVVYEALQEHPRRTVALKVLKPGIASASALRRFEHEAQLLARLQHPNIAQVYEAGTDTSQGEPVPFFAMEYIPKAKPITEYARERGLGLREKLGLLVQVCEAVHHGHQKGIIHRDLKPSNILVNAEGLVKTIDFGVARATDSDLGTSARVTEVGQLIGTMQYMSPEQCAADPHAIDVRSDVYALGVVIYELLCGELPYQLTKAALHEAVRVIREEPPKRPSTINRRLRGDVETIALKALEKEPSRRYQSALQLGEDIRRYLAGEAIVGRPPSIIYQLRVFARRHRLRLAWLAAGLALAAALLTVSFGALVAVLAVLGAGLLASSALFVRAEQARAATALERDRAVQAEEEAERKRSEAEIQRKEAEAQRVQAEAGRAEAEAQRRQAESVANFLSHTLAAVDPAEAKGREATVREVLGRASEWIKTGFPNQPTVEAALRTTIGKTYQALGDYPTAEAHLEMALKLRRRALGAEHSDTLASLGNLALLYQDQGRYAEAEPLHVQAVEVSRRVLGEEHPDTLDALANLATLYQNQGRRQEAEPLYVAALAVQRRVLGEEHPDTLGSLGNLAVLYHKQGRYQEAEPLYVKVLAVQRRVLGEEHPETLISLSNLGAFYYQLRRYEEAEPLSVKALAVRRHVLGEEHPGTLNSMNNLAVLYESQGRFQEAEPLYMKALEVCRRVLGEKHPHTVTTIGGLIKLYEAWGKPDLAAEWRVKLTAAKLPEGAAEPSGPASPP